jgi:hypothetical protein
LLASGKLTPDETADIQQRFDGLVAGKELDAQECLRAKILFSKYQLGEERVQAGRSHREAKKDELVAKFDAMPRPKKPPGK